MSDRNGHIRTIYGTQTHTDDDNDDDDDDNDDDNDTLIFYSIESLMRESNFAEGCNVLMGEVDKYHPCNSKYGKIHTGDAWLPARNQYCTMTEGPVMPVGIIVFGDKSHMDLHGTLSLTPIIFTLILFNRLARNNT
jgi:hypothetical protein